MKSHHSSTEHLSLPFPAALWNWDSSMAWGRKDQEKSLFYFFQHKAFHPVLKKLQVPLAPAVPHLLDLKSALFQMLFQNTLPSVAFISVWFLLVSCCGIFPFPSFSATSHLQKIKLPLIKWFLLSWQNPSISFCHVVVLKSHFERLQHKATQVSASLRRCYQLIICD